MKTHMTTLKEFYSIFQSLDRELREEICRKTGWSEATFYRKLSKGNVLPPLEKDGLAQICRRILRRLLQKVE